VSLSDSESVVGRKASVSFPIPGGEQPGEVVVRIRGGSETYMAYCDEALAIGTDVVVLADRGARCLTVTPL
jgi:membrane protein implicated in regulation of membrane protease activity